MERRAAVQTPPQFESSPAFVAAEANRAPRRTEDRVYQFMTVIAMLLLLASLWAF